MQENTSSKQQRQGLTTKAGENLMRTSALFDLTGRLAIVTGGNGVLRGRAMPKSDRAVKNIDAI